MPARSIELHSLADRVEIAPGVWMPRLGLGTYKAPEGPEVLSEVETGLRIGYRGIDTAALYGNEHSVGEAIRRSGLTREDVFVATKVWNADQGYRSTLAAFSSSLERLGFDFVDLYLIHWPNPELMEPTWRAMQEIQRSGRARAIGVCNFLVHHLELLATFAETPPAVDQLELHPGLQQPEVRAYCAEHGITVQAWAPVMRGRAGDVPELVEIARRHGKTPAQVSIRWILQSGVTTIPKSTHEERLRENADVFDFELTAEEMATIDSIGREQRLGPDPNRYGGARYS